MKKTYISPNMAVVNIEVQMPIAGSPLVQDVSGDVTSGKLQDEGASEPGLSRGGRGFWDDEEDY